MLARAAAGVDCNIAVKVLCTDGMFSCCCCCLAWVVVEEDDMEEEEKVALDGSFVIVFYCDLDRIENKNK